MTTHSFKGTAGKWRADIVRLRDDAPAMGFGIFPATERTDLPQGVIQHSLASANMYEHSAFTAFYTPEEIEANARLIAAAPDLLEALVATTAKAEEHLRDMIGARQADFRNMANPKYEEAYQQETARIESIIERARAAIAKALGGDAP